MPPASHAWRPIEGLAVVASLHRLGGAARGAWVLDALLRHGEAEHAVFLDIDPRLLSADEDGAEQRAAIQATAQWIRIL